MQLSTAAVLKERWLGADVTLTSPFPEYDTRFYEGVAQVVRCHRRRLVFATLQIVRAAIWRTIRNFAGVDVRWLIPDAELRATRDADLVIDLSGDMLTDDYGPHVAYSHYIPIINALLLERPVFICAQSIGPFRWTGWLAKQLFSRAAAITVRDEISLDHLAAIGIERSHVQLTADMAFLLRPASAERIDEILHAERVGIGERPLLGVSLSRILEQRYASLNREPNESFTELLARVLDEFASKYKADVIFVPHVTGPVASKDDRRIGMEVAALMKTQAHVIRGDYRPEELKGVISRCTLFLGARMHANIGALSSAVPVVALSYSHKTLGIMRFFGQEGLVIPGERLDDRTLLSMLDQGMHANDKLRAHLQLQFAPIQRAASQNQAIVARLLDAYTDQD